MKKLAELFGSSSRELKSVRTITVCAMLAAAAIILVNFRIELTNTQRIGFSVCGGAGHHQVSHQAGGGLLSRPDPGDHAGWPDLRVFLL